MEKNPAVFIILFSTKSGGFVSIAILLKSSATSFYLWFTFYRCSLLSCFLSWLCRPFFFALFVSYGCWRKHCLRISKRKFKFHVAFLVTNGSYVDVVRRRIMQFNSKWFRINAKTKWLKPDCVLNCLSFFIRIFFVFSLNRFHKSPTGITVTSA